ncbi:hypothetical protein PPERSA_02752 [Pseudocohnilembus persalinus]|uniref:Prolyl endopeptidase n=1 Tax=Pseudocohnilembus persalinus TaxID=266149 RepID=A0A0V0R764_PSEPJ|nr:hypothetical protein PPERSA_02752 [Pseudocohnilembus persalinus]|eukprot:KRX10335.1 hypothetical protein PPERSA_02752 [Pseudocohnilembus persalinus]
MQKSNIIQYPETKRDGNFQDERGNSDPYRWLENPDSIEVQQWFSVDGNYFAYGLKNGGTDWTTAYILDVKNSKKLEDKLEFIKFSSYAWTHDNKGFFYNCFEKPQNIDTTEGLKAGTETQSSQNQKVYFHKLGTKQEQDILIYQSHSKEIFRYEISNDGQYFILYTNWGTGYNNKLYFANLKDFSSKQELKNKVFKQPNIKGFDPNEYETKQVFYENKKDKTKIPMFITSKKGSVQNGPKPLLLYGYGGFNISMNPNFDPFRIVMIKNLGINYAVANIRGGGEYGQQWHKEGMFENKQNVFDDFQFAAEYLIENKYTTSNQLGIFGRSNGGLLVGACVNQRPDLFKAGLAQVAVLDMLRFHKFTTGFAACADYGNPDNEEDYKYIVKYSPYHNINKNNKPYPALLFTTGDHDDRVVPLHSYKYISALQHELGNKEYQKQPILIRVDEMAGHGEGKPTQKLLDEYVDMYTFLSLSLNSPFQD